MIDEDLFVHVLFHFSFNANQLSSSVNAEALPHHNLTASMFYGLLYATGCILWFSRLRTLWRDLPPKTTKGASSDQSTFSQFCAVQLTYFFAQFKRFTMFSFLKNDFLGAILEQYPASTRGRQTV